MAAAAEDTAPEEAWFYEPEDLEYLPDTFHAWVDMYGSSEGNVYFSSELVEKYTAEELIRMTRRATYMICARIEEIRHSVLPDGTLRIRLIGLKLRSGERMLDAYLYGEESKLTAEEMRCLRDVEDVMEGLLRTYPEGSLELERAIFDYIAAHVTYQSYPTEDRRFEACTSACSAFLQGWGNCQAYSDLFCLMAGMGGFNVGRISGIAGDSHMWNWIGLWVGDEYREYMVDVTFGDCGDGADHSYLNFGLDRAKDRIWYKELYPNSFEAVTDARLSP